MTEHLKAHFEAYMTACHGSRWITALPENQVLETRQAFYMGALTFQGMALSILDPDSGPTTPDEEARGEKLFAELAKEIEAFGESRIIQLFEQDAQGRGRA
jgi:hypothetical protein